MLKTFLVLLRHGKTIRTPDLQERDAIRAKITPLFEQAVQIGKSEANSQLERVSPSSSSSASLADFLQQDADLIARSVERSKQLFGSRVEDLGETAGEDEWEEAMDEVADTVASTEAQTVIPAIVQGNVLDAFRAANVESIIWVTSPGACSVCLKNAAQGAVPPGSMFESGATAPPEHPRCRCHLDVA